MHTLKPLDNNAILSAARQTSAILILEEHSIIGGLGSTVAKYWQKAKKCRFVSVGLVSHPFFPAYRESIIDARETRTRCGIIGKDNQGIPWEESLNAVMIVYK